MSYVLKPGPFSVDADVALLIATIVMYYLALTTITWIVLFLASSPEVIVHDYM